MGPKKAITAEEGDDIKKSLEFMTEEISTIRKQQITILTLVEEVKTLRLQNAEKDKRVLLLETKVAELEQYTRLNYVIVSGLRIKPQTYAIAVTNTNNGQQPDEEESTSVEQQVVVTFLKTKAVEVDSCNTEACHLLSRRSNSEKQAVIIRFANRKHKMTLIKQGKKLKGTNVYMNDHLTKQNADIARKARYLKEEGKIQHTRTSNCKIYIKLKGTPEQANVLHIRNMEELDKY
uniref:Helentron 4 helitron-like transposon replicase/helicase/endonuclease n=1 Tax=Nothobranchius furzeri TaxID=105023 RepID=A0A1A8AM46_NOTFU